MKDAWQSGDPYDLYMGRWSRLVAERFVDWLSPAAELRWLDVGCGTGALSEAALDRQRPRSLVGIDQSEGFVRSAQRRLGSRAACKVANAMSLPLDDATVDVAVSGLVLNFVPEPERALGEMRRVCCAGGTVAVYVWDYAGKMDFLNQFWDAAVELDPNAAALHEGRRFPDSNAACLTELFVRAGLSRVEAHPIEIVTRFSGFQDYWQPFLGGQGPAPTYVSKLTEPQRMRLEEALAERLPVAGDGSILLSARAWATRGLVPS